MYKLDLQKAEELEIKLPTFVGKAREFQKNKCFTDYAKAFDCVDHNKLWKILKNMGIPYFYLTPEKPVYKSRSNRTGHGTMDWLKIGKEVCQGYTLSPAYMQGTSCLMPS